MSTEKVEKASGPYIGPDIELARACAMAVIPVYGNDDPATHERIMQNGIWNDHVAVQAAFTAIRHMKAAHTLCTFGPPAERERRWILQFEDAEVWDMHFKNEDEALRAFNTFSMSWTCTLFVTAEQKV